MSVDDDGPPPPAPMLARRPTRDLPPLPIETNFNELVLFVEEETVECTVEPQNILQSPVEMTTDTEPSSLTPLQAHYLKKSLISLQFHRELESIFTTTSAPIGARATVIPLARRSLAQAVRTIPAASPRAIGLVMQILLKPNAVQSGISAHSMQMRFFIRGGAGPACMSPWAIREESPTK